ncbi:hypothetical protein B0H21DRAFT_738605 [Amylocystis lapponica]|nr:hypothetical protein B0H21DRAFT_738605 [Amylocystis lapponica]
MIDHPPQPLNTFNVAHLAFALSPKALPLSSYDVDVLPAQFPPDSEIDYLSRRMSSSATSDSSLHSRPEKRGPSPLDSPLPKKLRSASSLDPAAWSHPNTPSPQPTPDLIDKSDFDPSRVQLPSITSAFQDHHELRRASLPTLYSESPAGRLRPYPSHRPSQSSSGLVAYQFPAPDADDKFSPRPRLAADTQLGVDGSPIDYYSISSTTVSSNSPSSFNFSPLSPDYARSGLSSSFSSDSDHWASSIVRPNSTPGHIAGPPGPPKYDDSLRHSSLGGPAPQQHRDFYGGVSRISGHSARHTVKSEDQWTFPNTDFVMSAPTGAPSYPSTPSTSASVAAPTQGAPSPSRSPQTQMQPAPTNLIERPPRKRGKLPKPVTDFLKDWLHRHSDHPYPSEEEKKQLCNATGLSMSQVSNWMINARRRILAPAHRAAAGPTTTTPFSARMGSLSGPPPMPSVLDTGRRASMPTDSLQLYYPLSLQSLHGDPARHMGGMPRSLSSSHGHSLAHSYTDYASAHSQSHSRASYSGSGALHPHAQSHGGGGGSAGGYLGVPLSAPPQSLGPPSFLGSQPHASSAMYGGGGSGGYHTQHSSSHGTGGGRSLAEEGGRYAFPEQSASPQPGSGYATPQG